MTRGTIQQKVLSAKIETIREMLLQIQTLPLESVESFAADPRMVAAGESFLRRALEALLDLSRHLLAKGFGVAATEYKAVPRQLLNLGLIEQPLAEKMVAMAGYRNRLVHFYAEVTVEELHRALTENLSDVEAVVETLLAWVEKHPERVDSVL